MRLDIKKIVILYFILCLLDSILVRNLKKKILYSRAVKLASSMNKELVVLGSPHLGLVDGGVISFVTEKTIGPVYGCGDTCVDIIGCNGCRKSYKGDILDYLRTRTPKSCVLFSTGVFEFTKNYEDIKKEIDRTCVANFTEYYSPWNITWYAYGCDSTNMCGLFKALPRRVFWNFTS